MKSPLGPIKEEPSCSRIEEEGNFREVLLLLLVLVIVLPLMFVEVGEVGAV